MRVNWKLIIITRCLLLEDDGAKEIAKFVGDNFKALDSVSIFLKGYKFVYFRPLKQKM